MEGTARVVGVDAERCLGEPAIARLLQTPGGRAPRRPAAATAGLDPGSGVAGRGGPEVDVGDATGDAVESLARDIGDLEILSQDEGSLLLTLSAASQHLPRIFEVISGAGGSVSETSLRSPNLETLFLLLTGKELRE